MPDLQTKLAAFLGSLVANRPQIQTGPDTAPLSVDQDGTLTVSTTAAQTAADLIETDLWTYTLLAGALDRNGRGVRLTAFGTLANTANTKTIKVYFGGTVVGTYSAAGQNVPWYLEAVILRSGASAELSNVIIQVGATPISVSPAVQAVATTGAIIVKVTGQNGTAAAADIVFSGAVLELI